MTDQEINEQADQMATYEYLSQGYFGGKKSYGSKNIKYFDFEATKQSYIDKLRKEG